MADNFFFYFYLIEMGLKMLGLGLFFTENSFFKDNWNIFDFIVNLSLILSEFFHKYLLDLSSLRSMRILKVLKSIRYFKNLRIILISLFSSFKALLKSILILNSFYVVYAVIGLHIFSGKLKKRCIYKKNGIIFLEDFICGNIQCPENYFCVKLLENPNGGLRNFDNFFYSFVQVFQLATLEDWTAIMYDIIKSYSNFASLYFISFIAIGSYFLLNLMLVVIKVKFTEVHSALINKKEKINYVYKEEKKEKINDNKLMKESLWKKKYGKEKLSKIKISRKKNTKINSSNKLKNFDYIRSTTDMQQPKSQLNIFKKKFTILVKPNGNEDSIGISNNTSYEINDLDLFQRNFPKKIIITKKSHRKLQLKQFFTLASKWVHKSQSKINIPQFFKIRIQNEKTYSSESKFDVLIKFYSILLIKNLIFS